MSTDVYPGWDVQETAVGLRLERGPVVLYCGDSLEIIPSLEQFDVDAVVTDPPYSSGGAFRGDRTQRTITKYVQSGMQCERTEFGGDSRDQRAFLAWCSLWLAAARGVCSDGAVLCSFIDWRQLPVLTDAIQCGGWVWRNVATWWKPGVRMQRGRFSGSAEYIIYATNGPHASDGEESPQNVFSLAPLSGDDKDHIAEKPVEVLEWALGVVRAGGLVLDPFAGSFSTVEACIRTGRRCIAIEQDRRYFDQGVRRVTEALQAEKSSLFPAKTLATQPELF